MTLEKAELRRHAESGTALDTLGRCSAPFDDTVGCRHPHPRTRADTMIPYNPIPYYTTPQRLSVAVRPSADLQVDCVLVDSAGLRPMRLYRPGCRRRGLSVDSCQVPIALFTIRRRKHISIAREYSPTHSGYTLWVIYGVIRDGRKWQAPPAGRARGRRAAPSPLRAGPGGGARGASRGGGTKGHERERPTSRGARHVTVACGVRRAAPRRWSY